MYFRPLDLTASSSLSASSSEPKDGRHRGGRVLAVLENVDAVPGVAGGIGRHENRLDRVVLDHVFERRIGLRAAAGLRQRPAAVGKQVADGRHRDVGMILEAELGAELAGAVADDAHANLPLRHGLPDSLGALRGRHAGSSQDLLAGALGRGRLQQPAGGDRAERAKADIA